MKAMELVRWALQLSDEGTAGLVEAMRETPMTPSTPGGKAGDGNHSIWTLGHLCVIEGGVPEILLGEPNPVEKWKPLFSSGTKPSADASVYPSFDELLKTYRSLRARNMKLLEQVGEAGLERVPVKVPPGLENAMKTFGHTLLLVALHNMVHYGQIADARRVAGHKPLM